MHPFYGSWKKVDYKFGKKHPILIIILSGKAGELKTSLTLWTISLS